VYPDARHRSTVVGVVFIGATGLEVAGLGFKFADEESLVIMTRKPNSLTNDLSSQAHGPSW
jgi:hypothetical protein